MDETTALLSGEWECLTTSRQQKCGLEVRADGTFEFSRVGEDGNWVRICGGYTTSGTEVPGLGVCPTLVLEPETSVKEQPFYGRALKLFFSATHRVLTDPRSIAFARWEESDEIKAELTQPKRASLPTDTGEWTEVWEVGLDEIGSHHGIFVHASTGQFATTSTRVDELDDILVVFDRKGQEVLQFELSEDDGNEIAWGEQDGASIFVTFGSWSDPVTAYGSTGELLWTVDSVPGVNDVAISKLAHGKLGVVVGYNGSGGIKVYDAAGEVVSAIKGPGNVFALCTIISEIGAEMIIAINLGTAEAFTVKGESIIRYPTLYEAGMVRTIHRGAYEENLVLTMGTIAGIGETLTAFKLDGTLLWSTIIEPASDDHRIFQITINGEIVIGLSSENGVLFYSCDGHKLSQVDLPITGAASMPTKLMNDRLLLRGRGFIKCFEIPEVALS